MLAVVLYALGGAAVGGAVGTVLGLRRRAKKARELRVAESRELSYLGKVSPNWLEAVQQMRLLSELGDVPALPHSLRISGDPDQIGWQLCDMAPLASIDLQRLLVADGLEARLLLLVELCDAMCGDVVGLLAGGEPGGPD